MHDDITSDGRNERIAEAEISRQHGEKAQWSSKKNLFVRDSGTAETTGQD